VKAVLPRRLRKFLKQHWRYRLLPLPTRGRASEMIDESAVQKRLNKTGTSKRTQQVVLGPVLVV